LSELEEIHRQRSREQLEKPVHRSLNKRTRVVKMNGEMIGKLKEMKKQ
jgi:hypothetical protein